MNSVCRVWLRGGLGNQLASLCAGFVASRRTQGSKPSTLILDASVVDGSCDESRKYQLHNFILSDAAQRVCIREYIPPNEFARSLNSGMRKGLRTIQKFGISRELGVWHPQKKFESLLKHPRYIDGHFENTQIVLEAMDLGLSFPLPLRQPSPEFQALDPPSSDYIGVHVRLGDFREWRGGEWILESSYYSDAIQALGENPRTAKICLFSDDSLAAQEILAQAGVRLENIHVPSLSLPAEVLVHFSKFDRKVLSHSTFSWWAGVFGEGSICVFPEPSATMEPLKNWIYLRYQQ